MGDSHQEMIYYYGRYIILYDKVRVNRIIDVKNCTLVSTLVTHVDIFTVGKYTDVRPHVIVRGNIKHILKTSNLVLNCVEQSYTGIYIPHHRHIQYYVDGQPVELIDMKCSVDRTYINVNIFDDCIIIVSAKKGEGTVDIYINGVKITDFTNEKFNQCVSDYVDKLFSLI